MYDLTPEIIKPALFCFDQYQTYDLLWASNISTNVFNLLRNALPYNFIFDPESNSLPVLLIDRYTPSKRPWAKHWTTQVYEFLKIISRTGIADNQFLNGEKMNFPPAFDINLPDSLNLESFPETINLVIPADQEIFISWLEYAFDEGFSGEVHPQYSVKARIINRRERVIRAMGGDKNISLNTYGWLINSCVISNLDSLNTSNSLLLYSDLESTLENILNQLNLPDIFQVYTGFDVQCNWREFHAVIGPTQDYRDHRYKTYFLDSVFGNPVQTRLPDWYFFASLIYANNNHWQELDIDGEIETLEDKGKSVAVNYNYGWFFFDLWNYDFTSVNESINIPANYPEIELSPIPISMVSMRYDVLDACGIIPGRYNYERTFRYDYGGVNSATDITIETNNTVTDHYRTSNLRKERAGNSVCTERFYDGSKWTYFGTTNYILYFFPLMICDPRLIKTCQGYYFYPRIGEINQFGSNLPYADHQRNLVYIERTSIKEIQEVNQQANGILAISRSINIEEDSKEFYMQTEGNSQSIFDPNGPPYSFSLSNNKQFYVEINFHENPPDSLEGLSSNEIYLIVNNLFVGETGGLVSTDSVRIKEIHAALNASEYAYDSDNPNNNAYWGLGRRIDAMASIQGLNFETDGKIRSIRQSKFVPQGQPIPAGWALGQWGRNEGGTTEGQIGGNEGETRYGLAYPVRSGKFDQDPYTGKPEKINVGGYVLVESFPQLLAVIMDDLDRGLGLQEAGAMVIPSADGSNYSFFQGMTSFVAELLYMQSENSKLLGQTWVSCLKNQGMLLELIKQQGVPTGLKQIEVNMGDKDAHKIPYTAFHSSAPTNFDLYIWVISHLALLVGCQYGDDTYEQGLYDDEETYPTEEQK